MMMAAMVMMLINVYVNDGDDDGSDDSDDDASYPYLMILFLILQCPSLTDHAPISFVF